MRDLEPPSSEEAAALARDRSPEQVKLFYLLRYVADYNRRAHEEPIEDYAEGRSSWCCNEAGSKAGPSR